MRFDKSDTPKVQPENVAVGPFSQVPTSHVSGAGDILEGVQQIGRAVAALGGVQRRAQEEGEIAVASDRELKFMADAGQLLYGAENGFLTRQGERALDTSATHEALRALREKYSKSLATAGARERFERRVELRMLGYQQTIERHAAAARSAIGKSLAEATLSSAQREAVRVYNDPVAVEAQIRLAQEPLINYMRDQLGLPAAAITEKINELRVDVYTGVLREYQARGQPEAGAAYLATIRDELGTQGAKWDDHFKKLSADAEVERLSTQVWDDVRVGATDAVTGRFDPAVAREAFRTKYGPGDRAKAGPTLERLIHTKLGEQHAADVQRLARIASAVRATGRLDKTSPDYTSLDDDGKNRAEGFVDRHLRELRSAARDGGDARRAQADLDSIAIDTFLSEPDLGVRADTSDEDIEAGYPQASDKAIATIKRHRGAAKAAVTKGHESAYKDFRTKLTMIGNGLGSNKKLREKYHQVMEAWYADQYARKGEPPASADVLKHLSESVIKLNVFPFNRYAFEVDDPSKFQPSPRQPHVFGARALEERGGPLVPLSAPQQPTAPQAQERVRVKYNGRILSIPKADLDEALRGGAEEVR